MEKIADNTNKELEIRTTDAYCIFKNKKYGFYWVINLEDHPSSFLLDKSYQNFSPKYKDNNQSMVIFQPTI